MANPFQIEDGVLLSVDRDKLEPLQRILYLPEGITAIGERALDGVSKDTIVVPEGCREIRKNAFQHCFAEEILLPQSIRVVEEKAFAWCNSLKEITIPEGVQEIPKDAFYMCLQLAAIHLPASLKSLSRPEDTGALQHMEIAPENPYLQTDGKSLLSKDGKTLYWLLENVSGDYRVPDGVTEIALCAFRNCKELTSVTMPDSVSTVGKFAFAFCPKLTSLHFSDSVENLEENLCYECSALEEVHFPAALKKIQEFAFVETALKRVDLPEGLTYIGRGSLNIPSLEELVIPSTLYEIFHNAVAFTHLKKLVYRPKSPFGITCATAVKNEVTEEPGQIDEIVLENVPIKCVEDLPNVLLAPVCRGYLHQVKAGRPLTEELTKLIGKMAHRAKWDFWDDVELVSFLTEHKLIPVMDYLEAMDGITRPEVAQVPDALYEYYQCFPAGKLNEAKDRYRLATELYIEDELQDQSIGQARRKFTWKAQKGGTLMITGYKGIDTEVVIPPSIDGVPVTAINDEAFSAVDKTISSWQRKVRQQIRVVYCPNQLVWIGNRAFKGCSKLQQLIFNGFERIYFRWLGVGVFWNCTSFDGDLPHTVETVHQACFYNCASIQEMDLPNAEGKIGPITFYGCTNLKRLYLHEGITEIHPMALGNCTSLEVIRLPKSLNLTDWSPFEKCPIQRVYAPKGSKAAKLAAAQGIRVIHP